MDEAISDLKQAARFGDKDAEDALKHLKIEK